MLDYMYTYMYIYTYMQATIYIRPEDEEAWKNVPNKSQWVHEGLNRGLVTIPAKNTPITTQHIRINNTPINKNEFHKIATDLESSSVRPVIGKPCCYKRAPCVHWERDELVEKWRNKLTGEEREYEI